MSKLTAKQTQFVAEYLIDLNATQAAIRAGYSTKTAQRIGSENLLKPVVATALTEAMKARGVRTEVTADDVVREITRLAMFDIGDLIEVRNPADIKALPEDVRRAIVGWSWDKQGNFTIKTAKEGALQMLGKHLGIYEMDNRQKVDALAAILAGLGRSVMPVARDA